jgi:hypothetical protein
MSIHGDYWEEMLITETQALHQVVSAIGEVLKGRESYDSLKDSAEFLTLIANILDD